MATSPHKWGGRRWPVVLDGENTVQFPYKSTWSEAEDFEMKLSQPAVEYARIPKDRKQQYLQKKHDYCNNSVKPTSF